MSEAKDNNSEQQGRLFPSAPASFLAVGLAAGLIFGLISAVGDLLASAALPLGMGRLGLETFAREIGYGLRWGLIWGLLLAFYGWLLTRLAGTTRRAIAAQLLGLGIWLLGALAAAMSLLRAFEERLPLPYQEEISAQVFLSRFIAPMLAYSVMIKPVVVLVLLALSFLPPMLLGYLLLRLLGRRVSQQPFKFLPSLALSKRHAVAGLIVATVFLAVAYSPVALGSPGQMPNVLLVSIDTLRADGLHSYGNPRPTSPVIDELAANGTRYENFFSSAPWTLPGHATMFTGLEPDVHGTYVLDRKIPKQAPLISEVFKNAGYRTFAVTSNFLVSPAYGFGRGFDRFILRPEADAKVVSSLFLKLLGRSKEPWFGFVHFFDPHLPYQPSSESRAELGIEGPAVEKVLSTMTHLLYRFIDIYLPYDQAHKDAVRLLYDGEVRDADRELGRILEQIDLENTLVIVTSDHGEEFNEHGWSGHTVVLYDESLRVPLILHGPGVETGLVIDQTTDLAQLVPLILNKTGLPDPLNRGEAVFGQGAYGHTNAFGIHRYSWRQDGWSFLTRSQYTYGELEVEHAPGLFDNLAEQENLLGDDPERAQRMQTEMEHFIGREIQRYGHMKTGETKVDEQRLQRLRELGYVQ